MLGRPAGRQPGPDRPHGPRAQAAHVRRRGQDGLQGDRGGLPLGQSARLRLRARADRGGPDPRRRHDPGADPVPPRPDRADLRVPGGGPTGHRPLLQLDVDPAAQGGVRTRPSRHHRHRRQCGQAVPQARADHGRHRHPLRVLARELHRHRARLRARGVRGGDGRGRADAGPADHPEPAGHGRDVHAEHLRRRDRVVPPSRHAPRLGGAVAPPPQRPRAAAWPRRSWA